MKTIRLIAAALLIGLSLSAAAFAAPKGPPAAVLAPVQTALAALNAGDAAKLATVLAPDATIVDEFAPYTWTGAGSGKAWLTGFAAFAKKVKMTDTKAVMRNVENFDVSGNRAYVVAPLDFTGKIAGKPFHETGTWTFTLVKSGSKWLARTVSWGTVSMSM